MLFQNRIEAGKKIAEKIKKLLNEEQLKNQLLVLAIPKGGVVIGNEIAKILNCPLDVIITKKIGAPDNPELAIGALGVIGKPVINKELALKTGTDGEYLKLEISNLKLKIEEQEKKFRQGKPPLDLKDKIIILTDDGVATGATMRAALKIIRQQEPKKIIVATPVIAKDSLKEIEALADEVIYLETPALFFAVGQFYQNFEQISDEEIKEILNVKSKNQNAK